MTSTIEPPYVTGRTCAEIERALTIAGKEIRALQVRNPAENRARLIQAVLTAEGR
jgi:hypothetical protein